VIALTVAFLLAVPLVAGYVSYQLTVHGLPAWIPR